MTLFSLSEAEFSEMVSTEFESLPDHIRQKMINVAIVTADEPSAEQLKRGGVVKGGLLLGLYEGVPLTVRGSYYSSPPDKITIFKRSIETLAGSDQSAIRQMVYDTLWHELAHHFGMNEKEVRDRERLRQSKTK